VHLRVVYARDSLHASENMCMPAEPVVIKVRSNGPYKVTGPVTIIDADGKEYELPEGDGIVLCRCGGSTTKPFCDGTHSRIGFSAAERGVSEMDDTDA
jgi:CDGSH-type Zn-finger protein